MKFVSTRSNVEACNRKPPKLYSFEEALMSGWAQNGGMLLPEHIPKLNLEKCRSLSYPELCFEIIRLFSGDEIPAADLKGICDRSFERFSTKNVIELHALDDNLYICELWHGPTLAFKDLGLQALAELLCYFLNKNKKRLNLLIGTSGDTGGSALEAFKGKGNVDVVCLYPKGRVSKVQERQMTSVGSEANCYVVACEGTSDELDVPVEAVLNDFDFKTKHCCGSVNSVNIGRILVQIVHFFWAYFRVGREHVGFSIPTGAAGHLTAGIIAMQMGLPIKGGMHVATNNNDIMHRFLSCGTATVAQSCLRTLSNAMDIQVPYNIERIVNLASGRNGKLTREWMSSFKQENGSFSATPQVMKVLHDEYHITSSSVSDEDIQQCIKSTWSSKKYLLDPHTAVGVFAGQKVLKDSSNMRNMTMICMGVS
uniref:threonine synthase n=1 Tax=Aplanochytrium stocchinoi TaxID=215587 RepID=A0A7S3PNT8_9STRA